MVVMDLDLPGIDGVETTKRIMQIDEKGTCMVSPHTSIRNGLQN